jgi:hypothetical protein
MTVSLREHAILAYRALQACADVLETIAPESTEEAALTQALQDQVQAAALGLFADLWPGHLPDGGEPLPADCIARVHTHEDLLLAIGKATAMGARLGQSVRVAVVPMRADSAKDQSTPVGLR